MDLTPRYRNTACISNLERHCTCFSIFFERDAFFLFTWGFLKVEHWLDKVSMYSLKDSSESAFFLTYPEQIINRYIIFFCYFSSRVIISKTTHNIQFSLHLLVSQLGSCSRLVPCEPSSQDQLIASSIAAPFPWDFVRICLHQQDSSGQQKSRILVSVPPFLFFSCMPEEFLQSRTEKKDKLLN